MVGPCYFFFNKRYIFIFLKFDSVLLVGCAGSSLLQAGFSLVVARGHCPPGGVQALGAHGLQLWYTDVVVKAQRVASFPGQGSIRFLHWQVGS